MSFWIIRHRLPWIMCRYSRCRGAVSLAQCPFLWRIDAREYEAYVRPLLSNSMHYGKRSDDVSLSVWFPLNWNLHWATAPLRDFLSNMLFCNLELKGTVSFCNKLYLNNTHVWGITFCAAKFSYWWLGSHASWKSLKALEKDFSPGKSLKVLENIFQSLKILKFFDVNYCFKIFLPVLICYE